MALDPSSNDHANIKMTRGGVAPALAQLPQKATKGGIVKATGIRKGGDRKSHFQGVAMRGGHAFLTLSGERDGSIIAADGSDTSFRQNRRVQIQGLNHPGGVQCVGTHVAVPVYGHGTEKASVQIYDHKLALVRSSELASKKAYCVGIANVDFDGGERYVLAVVSHNKGNRIDFYKSPVGASIDLKLTFEKHMTWELGSAITETWVPNRRWDGHPNSISLIVDESEQLYLLGLNTTPKSRKASRFSRWLIGEDAITAAGLGKDRAELYSVDLAADENQLTKVAARKMKCNRPAFRWGASATVVSESEFAIVSCESEAFKKRSKKVDVDLFRAT